MVKTGFEGRKNTIHFPILEETDTDIAVKKDFICQILAAAAEVWGGPEVIGQYTAANISHWQSPGGLIDRIRNAENIEEMEEAITTAPEDDSDTLESAVTVLQGLHSVSTALFRKTAQREVKELADNIARVSHPYFITFETGSIIECADYNVALSKWTPPVPSGP